MEEEAQGRSKPIPLWREELPLPASLLLERVRRDAMTSQRLVVVPTYYTARMLYLSVCILHLMRP